MISESEELVQGVADFFLPVLAQPAFVDSSCIYPKRLCSRASKPHLNGGRCWPVFAWKDALQAGFDLRPHRYAVRARPTPMH